MKRFRDIIRTVFFVFGVTVLLACCYTMAPAQAQHPATYVDKGACPFECCTYQRWTVAKDTVAYDQPAKGAKRVGLFKKGSRVRGLTGEVITTQPGKFVITKPHEKYKPGNILRVYTPQGEGFYKVWFGGKMLVEEMVAADIKLTLLQKLLSDNGYTKTIS